MRKIYLIRNRKVMLDMDLAELYGVETKQLKRSVRRNIRRFPSDFMIELSKEELNNWRSQFGTSNSVKMGLRIPPFAFTEYGILMLASVLNSDIAIQVNIRIVRIFAKLREMITSQDKFVEWIKQVDDKLNDHDEKMLLIFEYIEQLEYSKKQLEIQENRRRIGFKTEN